MSGSLTAWIPAYAGPWFGYSCPGGDALTCSVVFLAGLLAVPVLPGEMGEDLLHRACGLRGVRGWLVQVDLLALLRSG